MNVGVLHQPVSVTTKRIKEDGYTPFLEMDKKLPTRNGLKTSTKAEFSWEMNTAPPTKSK